MAYYTPLHDIPFRTLMLLLLGVLKILLERVGKVQK